MSSPLLQRLLDDGHATLVDESTLANFLEQQQHSLLFFAGDVRRYPESNDLAVILPELAKTFDGAFQIGLVAESVEKALQQQYGFNHWPTLVLLRGEAYLGVISKLQDWPAYCANIEQLLQSEPRRAPSFTIPLVSENNTCS
jgi:hydrogenase-1 operon protein HyaE